jgi:hypothetical protein
MQDNIPTQIKQFAKSPEIFLSCEEIGKLFDLHIDQIGELDSEIRTILLGIHKSSDFISNVTQRLEIDESIANKIAEEVNKKIFNILKEKIKAETTEEKTPEPSIQTPPIVDHSDLERAGGFTIENEEMRSEDYGNVMRDDLKAMFPENNGYGITKPLVAPQPIQAKPIVQEKPITISEVPKTIPTPPVIQKPIIQTPAPTIQNSPAKITLQTPPPIIQATKLPVIQTQPPIIQTNPVKITTPPIPTTPPMPPKVVVATPNPVKIPVPIANTTINQIPKPQVPVNSFGVPIKINVVKPTAPSINQMNVPKPPPAVIQPTKTITPPVIQKPIIQTPTPIVQASPAKTPVPPIIQRPAIQTPPPLIQTIKPPVIQTQIKVPQPQIVQNTIPPKPPTPPTIQFTQPKSPMPEPMKPALPPIVQKPNPDFQPFRPTTAPTIPPTQNRGDLYREMIK